VYPVYPGLLLALDRLGGNHTADGMDEALGQQHCAYQRAQTYAGNVRGRLPVYPLWQWSIRDPAYRFSTTIYGRWSPGVDSLRSEPLAVLEQCPMHDLVFRLRRIHLLGTRVNKAPAGHRASGRGTMEADLTNTTKEVLRAFPTAACDRRERR
jgi:hypothetical protein